jgi:predicted transcriptional regulator
MQANPSPRLKRDDESVQRAVLSLALDAHPKSLTIPQLAREIDRGDAVERAVRDLVAVGLLECQGMSVEPTLATLRFDARDQS